MCKGWYTLTRIYILLRIIKSIRDILYGLGASGFISVERFIWLLLNGYCLWIVREFMAEIKEQDHFKNTPYKNNPSV